MGGGGGGVGCGLIQTQHLGMRGEDENRKKKFTFSSYKCTLEISYNRLVM